MKRLVLMLVLAMVTASESHAHLISLSESINSNYSILDPNTANQLESNSPALLLAQGPRGPGPGDPPRNFRGPERYPYPGPQDPGRFGPDFWYGPGPRPAPAPRPAPPPPDPGPAGIIPHVLPLLLPPPRP